MSNDIISPRPDFTSVRKQLRSGQTTCVREVERYLSAIEGEQHLNAFLDVFVDEARSRAIEIDAKLAAGSAGPLAGMIIAAKDVLSIKDRKLTCGSRILENFTAQYDATVIARLKAADAILIGKTNMDEFAMGSSTENSAYGPVLHPLDQTRVPGGSSGGSAVAVAAGMAMTALGSDTGGSIRQPAGFCGIVGMKPTYGRVSRYGLVAFASSFDQVGPFANSVADAAAVLSVIAGHDVNDSTSATIPVPDYSAALSRGVKGLKVGLPVEYYSDALDPEIRASIIKQVSRLQEMGAEVRDVSLPNSEYTIAAYYILTTAEASSNLARYDGARYGHRSADVRDLIDMYTKSRTEGFGNEVKRRIMLGTYVLSAGYYDAYYRKGQKVRRLIKQDFDKAFEQVDCLITPTSPTTAFRLGEKVDDPLTMYLNDIYTVSANLAGIPGLSMPCGTDNQGLPIGLQIFAKQFDEETIFSVASALEGA